MKISDKIIELKKEWAEIGIEIPIRITFDTSIELYPTEITKFSDSYKPITLEQEFPELDCNDEVMQQIEDQIKSYKEKMQKKIDKLNKRCVKLREELGESVK
jgi:hypothetical protein